VQLSSWRPTFFPHSNRHCHLPVSGWRLSADKVAIRIFGRRSSTVTHQHKPSLIPQIIFSRNGHRIASLLSSLRTEEAGVMHEVAESYRNIVCRRLGEIFVNIVIKAQFPLPFRHQYSQGSKLLGNRGRIEDGFIYYVNACSTLAKLKQRRQITLPFFTTTTAPAGPSSTISAESTLSTLQIRQIALKCVHPE
jgi:hypothetical protein